MAAAVDSFQVLADELDTICGQFRGYRTAGEAQ
jgi:hypothetical protein